MSRLKKVGVGLLALTVGALVVGLIANTPNGVGKSVLVSDDGTNEQLEAARSEEQSLSQRIAQMQDVRERLSSQVFHADNIIFVSCLMTPNLSI
jgi:hypothetical protein